MSWSRPLQSWIKLARSVGVVDGGDHAEHERRGGVRARPPVAGLYVDVGHRLGHEGVEVRPALLRRGSGGRAAPLLDHPEAPPALLVLRVGIRAERDRVERRAAAEADVGVPDRAVVVANPEHQVRAGPDRSRAASRRAPAPTSAPPRARCATGLRPAAGSARSSNRRAARAPAFARGHSRPVTLAPRGGGRGSRTESRWRARGAGRAGSGWRDRSARSDRGRHRSRACPRRP